MVASLALLILAASSSKSSGTLGVRVSGTHITTPDGRPIRFRGFNVCWWVPPTAEDAKNIKALGANCVRCMFGYQPGGKFDPSKIAFLRDQVRYFTSRGLWIIPVVHDFRKDNKGPYDDPVLNREYLEMWDYVIAELKDEPLIAAWEPINEPHDSPADRVSSWYAGVIAHFRNLDPVRPIVVEGTGYSWPQNLDDSIKQSDPNLIYSFHTYGPWEYTAQKKENPIPYPGKWTRDDLAKAIEPAVRFRAKYRVPVWCGEWGVPTSCPGYQQWIRDVATVLDRDNFPWTYWGWALKPNNPTDDTFDVNPQKPEVLRVVSSLFAK